MLKVSTTYSEGGELVGNTSGEIGNLREQVRILREALLGVLESSEDDGGMNDIDWGGIRAALEATKEA